MKSSTLITILSTFLLVGCSKQQSTLDKKLDEAENIIEVNPDSASSILENIASPEQLDDKTFARWCMLSGKVTDEIFNTLLPSYQFERANTWYSSYGKSNEQVQILIYLGRSYANDGDYDKAMSIYTKALEIGEKNKLYNLVGYTYSYIGDLYREKAMRTEAIKKYKMAADYFKKENNIDSYACALRDMGREYASIDSLSHAIEILSTADSLTANSKDIDVRAAIDNALGNIYVMQNKYDEAKKFFYKALEGREKMPNYMALIDLYIASDSISQAKGLLQKIPQDDPTYTYSIKYLYYQIYKSEKKYEKALTYLEEYTDLVDSIVYADNQSKILKQQKELDKMKLDLYTLSLELEKKRSLLNTFKEKDENYDKMQKEIDHLFTNYRKLQNKILTDSPLYKELVSLANKNTPRITEPLISKNQWKLIVNEITSIYPNLYNYLFSLCPTLSDEDFQYCCFYLYGFDTNVEAKLLNIAIGSVSRKHTRLKGKLNITLPSNSTLYEYLMINMG